MPCSKYYTDLYYKRTPWYWPNLVYREEAVRKLRTQRVSKGKHDKINSSLPWTKWHLSRNRWPYLIRRITTGFQLSIIPWDGLYAFIYIHKGLSLKSRRFVGQWLHTSSSHISVTSLLLVGRRLDLNSIIQRWCFSKQVWPGECAIHMDTDSTLNSKRIWMDSLQWALTNQR